MKKGINQDETFYSLLKLLIYFCIFVLCEGL